MRVSSAILAVASGGFYLLVGARLEKYASNQRPLSRPARDRSGDLEAPLRLNLTSGPRTGDILSSQGLDQLVYHEHALFVYVRLGYQHWRESMKLLVDTGSDLTWVAKEGYGRLPGGRQPPAGKAIDNTFPMDEVTSPVDAKRWEAIYGAYGAGGTTMNIDVEFADVNKKMSLGLRGQGRWPGSKGHYDPLWLQAIAGTSLPKLFSIRVTRTPQEDLIGTLEVGGQLNDPQNGGVAPNGKEIVIPLLKGPRTPKQDWIAQAQFYTLGPDGEQSLGGRANVVLDTGASYVYLPSSTADAYNRRLGGMLVPPVPNRLVTVPPQYPGRPNLVLYFPEVAAIKRRVVIPSSHLVVKGPQETCLSLVLPSDNKDVNLMGMPWFLSVEKTVFDSGLERITVMPP